MKSFWDGFVGLAAALTSTFLVLGAIALAMTEGMMLPQVVETQEEQPTSALEEVIAGFPTLTPRPSATRRGVSLPTTVNKTPCPVPAGWEKHTIAVGETLHSLSVRMNVSIDSLRKGNCLDVDTLVVNSIIYLPAATPTATSELPSPTATLKVTPSASPTACGRYPGWVRYFVKPGDTFYRLSIIYSVSIRDLRYANCMDNGDVLIEGTSIWIPNTIPHLTATNTAKPSTATPLPPTALPFTPTFTRTLTRTSTFTFTPVPSTRTFTPTLTRTITPTLTPSFTPPPPATPTRTPTPTGTNPATKTSTPTAVPSFTPTTSGT